MAAVVLWHRIPPKDGLGNTPEIVARAFVNAVNANDLAQAASYWNPGDVRNVEANSHTNFEAFCGEFIECDSFEVTPVARQKEQSFLVQFVGTKANKQKAFSLYLKRIDGNWKLVMNKF